MDKFSKHKNIPKYITEYAREMRRNPTEAEKRLWEKLSNKQLDGIKFRRQFPINRYIADFYCHSAKLVIEIDGKIHDTQKEYDEKRTKFIEAQGIKVVRFTNDEVIQNIELVLTKIKSLIQ